MAKALTARQRRFVEEYLIDFNATQAAIRAGYSERTARSIGAENLTKPDIVAEVDARRQRLTDEADVTVAEIVEGLKKEAHRDDDGSSHAARVSAWGHLGKYRGMFTDRSEINARLEVVIRSE